MFLAKNYCNYDRVQKQRLYFILRTLVELKYQFNIKQTLHKAYNFNI